MQPTVKAHTHSVGGGGRKLPDPAQRQGSQGVHVGHAVPKNTSVQSAVLQLKVKQAKDSAAHIPRVQPRVIQNKTAHNRCIMLLPFLHAT